MALFAVAGRECNHINCLLQLLLVSLSLQGCCRGAVLPDHATGCLGCMQHRRGSISITEKVLSSIKEAPLWRHDLRPHHQQEPLL